MQRENSLRQQLITMQKNVTWLFLAWGDGLWLNRKPKNLPYLEYLKFPVIVISDLCRYSYVLFILLYRALNNLSLNFFYLICFPLFFFLLDLRSDSSSLSTVVSEAFVRFFVEMVGHYSLFMGGAERDDESVSSPSLPSPSSSSTSSFQREAFRKAVTSKSLRRFLEVFMETQMFTGFIQERDLRRQGLRGTEIWLSAIVQFVPL